MGSDRAARVHSALADVEAEKRRALDGLSWLAISEGGLADFNRELSAILRTSPPFDLNRLHALAAVRHAGLPVFGGAPARSEAGWMFMPEGDPVLCEAGEAHAVTVCGARVFGFDLDPNLFDSLTLGRVEEAAVVQRRILAKRAELDGVAARLEQSVLRLGLKEAGLRSELSELEQADQAGSEVIWQEMALEAVRGTVRGPIQQSLARFLGVEGRVAD